MQSAAASSSAVESLAVPGECKFLTALALWTVINAMTNSKGVVPIPAESKGNAVRETITHTSHDLDIFIRRGNVGFGVGRKHDATLQG